MKIMNRYITMILCAGILAVSIFSCQPDEFPSLGERKAIVPRLAGTWKLTQVVQRDNDAERKGFPTFAQQQDITDDFPFQEFKLVLDAANGTPSTFTIETGDSPNIIGNVSIGTWAVDDVNYPSKITFSGGDGVEIELGSFAGLDNGKLVFKLIRTQPKAGKQESVVTYQYSFTKE
jgi:hypothetical protein